MKCKECGNENFILTEEAGKLNMQLISLIPILIILCGISQYLIPQAWIDLFTNLSYYEIIQLGIKFIIVATSI